MQVSLEALKMSPGCRLTALSEKFSSNSTTLSCREFAQHSLTCESVKRIWNTKGLSTQYYVKDSQFPTKQELSTYCCTGVISNIRGSSGEFLASGQKT